MMDFLALLEMPFQEENKMQQDKLTKDENPDFKCKCGSNGYF